MPVVSTPNNQIPVEQPPPRIAEGKKAQNGPEIVMVQIDQDADQVLRSVQQNNFRGKIT